VRLSHASPFIDQPKLWSIGLLHMGQSFPGALAAVALPAIFRQSGMPLELFWVFALPLIPGWMRWLIAIVVDNQGSAKFGYRKSWIVPCTLLGASLYMVLAWVEPLPANIVLIVGILTLKSTIMTAQDVAIDGLAVESVNEVERPLGSSIIVFLMFMGTVAAQGMVAGVEWVGWQSMMMAAATLLILAALPSSLRKEPAPPAAAIARRRSGRSASIFEFLGRKESRYIIPTLLFLGFSSNFMRAMLPVFLVDNGMSLTDIGIVFAIAVVLGAGIAAVGVPTVSRRYGVPRVAGVLAIGYVPCAISFYALARQEWTLLPICLILTYVMFVSTAVWILVMEARLSWASQHQAATDFSAQSSCANLGDWLGASIAGFAAAGLGWAWFFHIGWTLSAAALVAFVMCLRGVERC